MQIPRGTTPPIPFRLELSATHLTGATGKAGSCVVKVFKASGGFVPGGGTVVEIGLGDYEYVPVANDTLAEGAFVLHIDAPSCDPVDQLHTTASDYIVLRQTRPIPFFMVDSTSHINGIAGLSPTVTISKAGAAFTTPDGTVSEIGGTGNGYGWYLLTPTADDTGTASTFILHAEAIGADSSDDTYYISNTPVPWSSSYLLALFNRYASRPTTDEVSDEDKYRWLTEAQHAVVADITARAPNVLYGAPQPMTTSDNNVFTFGTDGNGYPVFPMGNARIFRSLKDVPDYPMVEGVEYLSEGTQIRIPNQRTEAGPLYWYGESQPTDISASSEPVLNPEPSRNLIALEAARRFVQANGQSDRAADLGAEYGRELPRWLLVWKRQFSSGAGMLSTSGLRAAMLGRVA